MSHNQLNSQNSVENTEPIETEPIETAAAAEASEAEQNTETRSAQDPAQTQISDADLSSETEEDEAAAIPEDGSDTVAFPDFPERTDEAAAAALYAALNHTTEETAEPAAQPLFEGIDSEEYDGESTVSDTASAQTKSEEPVPTQAKKKRKWPYILLICVVTVIFGYVLVAFIPSGPIATLRNAYIQTAMSTADHQWLATWIFPQSVIDRAWTDPNVRPDDAPDTFEGLETAGTDTESVSVNTSDPEQTPPAVTDAVTEQPPEQTVTPDKADQPDPETDILGLASLKEGGTDYAGNKVLVVDKEEGLFISEFSGKSQMIPISKYHGYVMVIDDPSRVFIGSTPEKDTAGYRILDMMNYYGDIIAGINASGFADPNDSGTGNDVIGACLSEGQFWGYYDRNMASVVLTKEHQLIVGWLPNWSTFTNIRDGMQFGPPLVSKGQNLIDENGGGWGAQPRTAIGQREDGAIIMIVIDGRVPSSIGCTLWEMADMMVRYGAVTAGGCDGGSSVVLAYDGKVLNANSSANPKYGRRIPNAFLVRSKKDADN